MEDRLRMLEARLVRAERREFMTRCLALVTLAMSSVVFSATPGTTEDKGDAQVGRFSSVEISKPANAQSALDIRLPGTGRAIRFYAAPVKGDPRRDPRTYFNDAGMLYTNGWIVISGTSKGTGEGFNIEQPNQDPAMLAIWSDVLGPAINVRAANAGADSYLFQGLDRRNNYTFSIEQNGGLRWGAGSRAAMDTNLYRSGVKALKTDGSLLVTHKLGVGTPSSDATMQIGGSQSVHRRAVESDTTLTDSDYYVGLTNTTSPQTVSLPTAVGKTGRVYVIKDESGGAGTRPITLKARPTETIDGASAARISTNYGVLRLISNGSNWYGM